MNTVFFTTKLYFLFTSHFSSLISLRHFWGLRHKRRTPIKMDSVVPWDSGLIHFLTLLVTQNAHIAHHFYARIKIVTFLRRRCPCLRFFFQHSMRLCLVQHSFYYDWEWKERIEAFFWWNCSQCDKLPLVVKRTEPSSLLACGAHISNFCSQLKAEKKSERDKRLRWVTCMSSFFYTLLFKKNTFCFQMLR